MKQTDHGSVCVHGHCDLLHDAKSKQTLECCTVSTSCASTAARSRRPPCASSRSSCTAAASRGFSHLSRKRPTRKAALRATSPRPRCSPRTPRSARPRTSSATASSSPRSGTRGRRTPSARSTRPSRSSASSEPARGRPSAQTAPPAYVALAQACWAADPAARPTFAQIVAQLNSPAFAFSQQGPHVVP